MTIPWKREVFFKAAECGDALRLQRMLTLDPLLAKEVSLKRGHCERTALIIAASSSNANSNQCVEVLLPLSDAHQKDLIGCTALLSAVCTSQMDNVRSLIAIEGVALDRDHGGRTALMRAADVGLEEAVAALLPISDRHAKDNDGWTCLHHAAAQGAAGQNGESKEKIQRVIEQLLAAGLDPMARTREQTTALHIAAENPENALLIRALLRVCDPLAVDREGVNALMVAAKKADAGNVQALLEAVPPHAVDGEGRTALMHAAEELNLDTVRVLVQCCDVNAVNEEEEDALRLALWELQDRHRVPWPSEPPADPDHKSGVACIDVLLSVCGQERFLQVIGKGIHPRVWPLSAQVFPLSHARWERESLEQELERTRGRQSGRHMPGAIGTVDSTRARVSGEPHLSSENAPQLEATRPAGVAIPASLIEQSGEEPKRRRSARL